MSDLNKSRFFIIYIPLVPVNTRQKFLYGIIQEAIKNNAQWFADDTSVSMVKDSPRNVVDIYNVDLDKIHKLSEQWLVKFNSEKLNLLSFLGRTPKQIIHPCI